MTVKPEKVKGNQLFPTNIVEDFRKITKHPAQFLCELPKEKCKIIRNLLQNAYKVAVNHDLNNANNVNILPELVVDDMDEEQIWQQIELRNVEILNQLNKEVPKLLSLPEENLEVRLNEEEDEEEDKEDEEGEAKEEEEEDDEEEEDEEAEDSEEEEFKNKKQNKIGTQKRARKSIVDDKFFKLSEMERFLEEEDAREVRKFKGKVKESDESGIDHFAQHESDEEEEEENVNYKDFFESDGEEQEPQKDYFANNENELEEDDGKYEEEEEKVEDEEQQEEEKEDDDDDDENEGEDVEEERKFKTQGRQIEPASNSDSETDTEKNQIENKSSFEMRQERLKSRIKDYENEVLGEKPWQLKGEIVATNRPQNSLLEEVLEFESTTRPAPIITEETTRRLEDIIRQRIKDQAWDDVEQKVRPQLTQKEFRKKLVLDQEKSKQSLAQIYESEYQKELAKLNPDGEIDKTVKENPAHREIKNLMQDLFVKLDALSNFHFVPKPIAPEPRIITNTPAINMEEVAPIAMSDGNLLAPEEVYRGTKHGQLLGKSERTRTDKKRERRQKKQKQRSIHKALEAKDVRRQKLGIPLSKKEESARALKSITKHRNVEKITTNNDKSALKSSSAFFTQLQDQTTTNAKSNNKKRKQNDELKKKLTPKKLKL